MNDLKDLFSSARSSGDISNTSLQLLSLPDLGAKIQQGLGIAVDNVPASEVFLLSLLVDDSGSIRSSHNEPLVIAGTNEILQSLTSSKQESSILVHTRYLNGKVLCPFAKLSDAKRMSSANYQATGSTPLYDESVALLGTVIAKTQEFADSGVPARSVTVIITDGEDAGSQKYRARDVRNIVEDMLRREQHIVAGFGLDNGRTNFRKVFHEMGIEDRWILTPGADKKDIRAAFRVVSQAAVRTSQGATAGGFA